MVLETRSRFFKESAIGKLERRYEVSYVCESGINLSADVSVPALIFYGAEAHPRGSNYMAVFQGQGSQAKVCDGLPLIEKGFVAVQFADGRYYHSTHRHDFHSDPDNPAVFIDGGRDYVRTGCSETALFKVYKDRVRECT